jgi:RNA polymerase-binding transcription factor DksA
VRHAKLKLVRKNAGAGSAGGGKSARAKLNKKDRQTFLELLLDMRERLVRQVGALKNDSLQRNEEIVTGEDGTEAFDRQFALSVASSELEAIYDIDDALRRLEVGIYGVCEECSCVIEKPRLKALPFVRLCIKCQSDRERGRPRFNPWNN